MVGDFSSTPDGELTGTYELVLEAGFADLWQVAGGEGGREEAGPTCCQAPNLRNPESDLSRRLDFVFFRDAPDRGDGPPVEAAVTRIGAEPTDRTASGLWPSDHAGLVASLRGSMVSDGD